MSTPLILLLGLTVATCVIAYWSDNLGKKLGKKRISLMGLRPRQTATLISMASSVGIMVLTLGVLLLFSVSLRNALTQYDHVRGELNRLKPEVAFSRRAAAVARRELVGAEANLEQAGQRLGEANKRLVQTQARLGQVQSKLAGVEQARKQAVQARVVALQAKDRAQQAQQAALRGQETAREGQKLAEDRAGEAQRSFAVAQRSLAAVTPQLAQAKTRLARTRQNLAGTKARLAVTNLKLDTARKRFATVDRTNRRSLEGTGRLLQTQAELQFSVSNMEAELKQRQDKVDALQAREVALKNSVSAFVNEVKWNNTTWAKELATNDNPNFAVNTAFAAATIKPSWGRERIMQALRDLMDQSNSAVTRLLVASGKSSQEAAQSSLHLASLNVETEQGQAELSEPDILENVADYLLLIDGDVSVRVVAARNHLQKEKDILGRIVVVPARRVFGSGEVIASTVIDGSQSDAQIYNQLLRLVEDGQRMAASRQVTPPLTPDRRYFFADGTNQRMFETLRRLQSLKKPANVRLVTASDVSTVEPVPVRFDIS